MEFSRVVYKWYKLLLTQLKLSFCKVSNCYNLQEITISVRRMLLFYHYLTKLKPISVVLIDLII